MKQIYSSILLVGNILFFSLGHCQLFTRPNDGPPADTQRRPFSFFRSLFSSMSAFRSDPGLQSIPAPPPPPLPLAALISPPEGVVTNLKSMPLPSKSMKAPPMIKTISGVDSNGFGPLREASIIENPNNFIDSDNLDSTQPANNFESLLQSQTPIRIVPNLFDINSNNEIQLQGNIRSPFPLTSQLQSRPTFPINTLPDQPLPPDPLSFAVTPRQEDVLLLGFRPLPQQPQTPAPPLISDVLDLDIDTFENEIDSSEKFVPSPQINETETAITNSTLSSNRTKSQIISLKPVKTFTRKVDMDFKPTTSIPNLSTNKTDNDFTPNIRNQSNDERTNTANKTTTPTIIPSPLISSSHDTLIPGHNDSGEFNFGNQNIAPNSLFLNSEIDEFSNLKNNLPSRPIFDTLLTNEAAGLIPEVNAGVLPLADELPESINIPFPPFT